ncbi:MAG: Ig-like domain-containing protein [Clostridium sp.]|nr:Ig-like domain-containing protein [Bacteroides sp.]MCM1199012.1 Ig-like domain-containing protein [Clostridium sp.]
MKRLTSYILAAIALIATGCNDNIPKAGSINNALVEHVVFDEALSEGLSITLGSTYSIAGHISAYPSDATNTAQRYESSNPAIADVSDQGILSALKTGDCIITVYIGTEGVNADFPVTVVKPPYISITQLSFRAGDTEYEIETGSVDMKKRLYIGSESLTEDANEPVLFSSSNEDVASIDANGILTIHKLGQTTVTASAEVSDVAPATIDLKFFKWVEYERFPGDRAGNEREIMGSSATSWNAMPHTDGGWVLSEFCWQKDASKKDASGWNAGAGQRNAYRYAMLDNRYIVSRSGAANNLPAATNGTAFCWNRPGGNQMSKETDGVYFIIDMGKSQPVSYFRTVNISDNADDRGVRVTRVSEIQGSNDGSSWTTLATGISDFNPRSTLTHESGTVYPLESLKATFDNDKPYRYIKFLLNMKDHCYGYYNNPADGSNADKDGNTMQIAELFMGYKAYSE